MMTESQTRTDLSLSNVDWQAFQFLAGELDEKAESDWGRRLAEGDVEACEAVARMVELVQAVNRSSQRLDTTVYRPARQGPLGALAAVSACLLLSLGLLWQGVGQELPTVTTDPDAEQLVSAWSDVGGPAEVAEEAGMALLVDDELDVPDWLIVAVSLQPKEDDE